VWDAPRGGVQVLFGLRTMQIYTKKQPTYLLDTFSTLINQKKSLEQMYIFKPCSKAIKESKYMLCS
jgi:hypothetical protein